MIRIALILIVLGMVGVAVLMRLVESDPSVWHVDPETAAPDRTPNHVLLRGDDALVYDVSPEALAEAVHRVALAAPRTTVLSGGPKSGRATYVQRSAVFAFPDYVSVKVGPAPGNGARLFLYSRSRFGYSDLGANADRIARWLQALDLLIGPPRGAG